MSVQEELILSKTQILEEFYNSFKKSEDFMVGLEYERISLASDKVKTAPYAGVGSLVNLITQFASTKGWRVIHDRNVIIGATNGKSSISLEPGGQLEISLEPKAKISDVQEAFERINASLELIARLNNIELVAVGTNPYESWDFINIVPKMRYKIMANFLPMRGKLAHVMMRQTAGIQINLDYMDEEDAILKVQTANKLSPFMSGFCANSPIVGGKLQSFKSYRALAWLHTDPRRCGIPYEKLFSEDFSFEDYMEALFEIPMLYIERDGLIIDLFGDITFGQFFEYGFEGYFATMEDWKLHCSLAFPDVRLKNYIEIRNHDSHTPAFAYAICAFYKGILYNRSACLEVLELTKHLTCEDLRAINLLSAKAGTSFEVKGKRASSYIKEFMHIARTALVRRGLGEEKYLDKLMPLVLKSKCPADLILEEKISDGRGLMAYLRGM